MPFFTTTTARPTTQAAPPPPTRSQRTSCYLARDGYFACLDRLDRSPADKDSTSCAAEQATFEKDCVSSWVEYFKKRHVMDGKKKELMEKMEREGAQDISKN